MMCRQAAWEQKNPDLATLSAGDQSHRQVIQRPRKRNVLQLRPEVPLFSVLDLVLANHFSET